MCFSLSLKIITALLSGRGVCLMGECTPLDGSRPGDCPFPLRAGTQLSSLLHRTLSGAGGSGWQQDPRVACCRVTHSRLCPIPNNFKCNVWSMERVGKTGDVLLSREVLNGDVIPSRSCCVRVLMKNLKSYRGFQQGRTRIGARAGAGAGAGIYPWPMACRRRS